MKMQDQLKTLARDGVLRVAINTGNRALVQEDAGTLKGVSPALAQRLADEIGARMEPVIYSGAGKVFDDAGQDKWDVGFLAIDAMRAQKIAFTQPYIVIEATYAVRAGTPPESFAEFRAGRCDAVAGVRASLEGAFAKDEDIQILPGALTSVHQAMVLPDRDDPRIAALDDFVARAIESAFIAAAQSA